MGTYPQEYLDFITSFNNGRFYESHEILEGLWRQTTGDSKLFYQGLIQAAVTLYQLQRNNPEGVRHSYLSSIEKLQRYAPSHGGMDVDQFLIEMEKYVNGKSQDGIMPKINLRGQDKNST